MYKKLGLLSPPTFLLSSYMSKLKSTRLSQKRKCTWVGGKVTSGGKKKCSYRISKEVAYKYIQRDSLEGSCF